jgi:hypothetical protein
MISYKCNLTPHFPRSVMLARIKLMQRGPHIKESVIFCAMPQHFLYNPVKVELLVDKNWMRCCEKARYTAAVSES